MEAKVLFLWDSSQSIKRLTAAEQAFIEECDPILHRYRRVCQEAQAEHLRCLNVLKPSERSDSSRPHLMSRVIKSRMGLAFPELVHEEKSGRFALHTKNYILLFNKLNEDTHLPCFPLSKASQDIKNQMTAEGGDDRPVIVLGYTWSESFHDLISIMAVYSNGGRVIWKIDLNSIAGTNQNEVNSPLPVQPLNPAEIDIPAIEIKKTV